jgi:hypothetical protein
MAHERALWVTAVSGALPVDDAPCVATRTLGAPMSPQRLASSVAVLAAVVILGTACGDDPAPAVGDGGDAASESTLPPAGGTGTGEIVIGERSYPFDADVCALSPASHEGRDYGLFAHGTGTGAAGSYEVEVFQAVADDGSQVETLRIIPGEGEVIAATNVVNDGETGRLAVSGSLVSGEMDFVSTNDVVTGTGIVNLTCG